MLARYTRRPLISRAICIGIGWTGLFIAGGMAQAQRIECVVATTIAGRAYDRVAEAIRERDYRMAMGVKQAFWDIEEHSHNCQGIRALAKALTDSGLGKERDSGGGGGTGGMGGGVAHVFPRIEPGTFGASVGGPARGSAATGTGIASSTGAVTAETSPSGLIPDSTVVSIEVEPRSANATSAAGATGAAVAGGSTGTGSTAVDRVYKVTLRMDDGTTRRITQESAPVFHVGDRVNAASGVIRAR